MRLARFWSRQTADATGKLGRVRAAARGWSNDSLEAAAAMARETASRIAALVADGKTRMESYQYGERPIPEPVTREFPDGASARAVVTRNVYGALVLNARDLMFIDIDSHDERPANSTSIISAVISLFAGKQPQPVQPRPPSPVEALVEGIAVERGLSLRLYETAAGHRAIVTNAPHSATADETEALLNEFNADPLYIRLCRQQESFRARLTPKPWRMKMWEPPVTYPFQTASEQSRFDAWEAKYASAAQRFATCRFIRSIGGAQCAPGFQELIDFHDELTKAKSGLSLA